MAEQKYIEEVSRNAQLYPPDKLRGDEARERRRRIREHNRPILFSAGKELAADLWSAGERQERPVPGLWCNEENTALPDRFVLQRRVSCTTDGQMWLRVVLYDRQSAAEAATRSWQFEPDHFNRSAIMIHSSSRTAAGYEGNGYGQVLLGLTNEFLESVLHHQERWPQLAASLAEGQVIYAHISDVARGAEEAMMYSEKKNLTDQGARVPVAPRQFWTSETTRQWLPNYRHDEKEVKEMLGFLPAGFTEKSFIARYQLKSGN